MVDIEAEKKAIKKLIDQTFKAENEHDLETYMKIYADDVIAMGPNMPAFQGKDTMLELIGQMFPTIVSIEGKSEHIEVSSSGDMAWDWGTNTAVYKGPDGNFEDQGKYFCTYKKVDGKWKCAAISWGSDLPPR
jgi:uncharacterized protein (TIGR02246 family)